MRPVEGIMLIAERRDIERSFASAPAVAPTAPPFVDESELGILDAVGSVMLLKRDATLFYEGDAADCYYKLVSGAARSCKLLPDGRRHITDFFLAGDFIGFHALDTHGCTAEAVSDAALVRYERRVVDALVARSRRVLMLSRMNAQERLASFLLAMAARNRRELCDTIPLPMTRSDIGDYLGLTTETVCRTLAQLRRAGMIAAPSPHELRLLQPGALAVLARGG